MLNQSEKEAPSRCGKQRSMACLSERVTGPDGLCGGYHENTNVRVAQ